MAWKYGCILFLCRRQCLSVTPASNANTARLQTMGVLGIAPRALPALYCSVLGLAQAASPDVRWQAGSVCSGAARAGRGGVRIMVIAPALAGWNHQNSGWTQENPKGDILHSGNTQGLCPASCWSTQHIHCSLFPCPSSRCWCWLEYSLSKASQIYITLFLY